MVVQTAARNKNWRLLTLLKHTLLICSCTVCSCTVHSLLISCTQRCTALPNLCSSCFEFCSAHPTIALLNADHAQSTSDHVHMPCIALLNVDQWWSTKVTCLCLIKNGLQNATLLIHPVLLRYPVPTLLLSIIAALLLVVHKICSAPSSWKTDESRQPPLGFIQMDLNSVMWKKMLIQNNLFACIITLIGDHHYQFPQDDCILIYLRPFRDKEA